ncbi:MAG: choice-of-anchor Q domain-containing protein [Wenzhouxiangella sp.]
MIRNGFLSAFAAGLLCLPLSLLAAVIEVTTTAAGSSPDECTLVDALVAANTDTASGGCPAGDGADVILLPPNGVIVLSEVSEANGGLPWEGQSALPLIYSTITIEGRGAEIVRNPAFDCDLVNGTTDPEFRLFQVGAVVSGVAVPGNLTLRDLTLRNGCLDNGFFPNETAGGAILTRGGQLQLERVALLNNQARNGGGAVFLSFATLASIIDSRLEGNASNSLGGAVQVNGATLGLANSSVIANRAQTAGGGLFLSSGTLGVDNSLIHDNEARNRGGIGTSNQASAFLEVRNSTVSANRALGAISSPGEGGGIGVANPARILFTSLVDNQGGRGSALHISNAINAGEVEMVNSLIAGGNSEARCFGNLGQLIVDGVNLADDDSCPGVEEVAGIGIGPLADNGGPSFTHALLPGSPALDRIDDCSEWDLEFDQRGQPRPGRGSPQCDVGAYEKQRSLVFRDRFEP